jgi:hypothetical protein
MPPLMRLSLFTRGKGKLAVIYVIIVRYSPVPSLLRPPQRGGKRLTCARSPRPGQFLCFASFSSFWLLTDLYYQQYLGLSPILTMVGSRIVPTAQQPP